MSTEYLGPSVEMRIKPSSEQQAIDRLVLRVDDLERENQELKERIAAGLDEVSRLYRAGYSVATRVRAALQGE